MIFQAIEDSGIAQQVFDKIPIPFFSLNPLHKLKNSFTELKKHRSSIRSSHLLALGNVLPRPPPSGLTPGHNLAAAGGERLPRGAREPRLRAEHGVNGGADGALAGPQRRAVGAEDGHEALGVVERVRGEDEVHLAGGGADDRGWGRGPAREAGGGVQGNAVLAVRDLENENTNYFTQQKP